MNHDCRILIVPGWRNSGPGHWQSLWAEQLPGTQRVEQDDWLVPHRQEWVARLEQAIVADPSPVVLVAHSLGCILVAGWAAHSPSARHKVRAALLVAPGDTQQPELRAVLPGWTPVSMEPLPFASMVVGSENDPNCALERSTAMAKAWGSQFVNAGAVGHINADSGLGNWDSGYALLQSFE